MKIAKIVIVDDEGNEQVLNITEAVVMAITEDNKILTQTSQNEVLNMTLIRTIIKGS
jgi:predicted DNA-binding ArsR family transcriptional regulator